MPKEGQVTLPVPPGMTEEQFLKLFQTFQSQRITGKAKGTATSAAHKRLIEAHQAEYDRYYKEEYAKAGGA